MRPAGRDRRPWMNVLMLLAASSPVAALPGLFGTTGLYRTVSAGTAPAGTYTFFFSALYQKAILHDDLLFRVDWAGVDTTLEVYDFEHYVDGTVSIGLTVAEHVELAASMSYLVNAYQFDQVGIRRDYVGVMDVDWGPEMIRGAAKYGLRVHPFVEAGALVWAGFPLDGIVPDTVFDYDGYWDDGDLRLQVRRPFLTTGDPCWGFLGLASTAWNDFEANLNLGYSSYTQVYEDTVLGRVEQRDAALDIGLGIAWDAPQAVLFTEFTMKSFLTRSDDPGYSSPARISAGIRLFEDTGSYLDIVGEYGLTDFDRDLSDPYATGILPLPGGVPGDWGVMVGLGFDSHMARPTSGTGIVAGTILDASNGSPLAGTVSFPESPVSSSPADPVTGFFSAPVIPGTIVVRAEAEGYVPASLTLVVEPGATATADFRLAPAAPPDGALRGSVTDESTGAPLAALITVDGGSASVRASQDGIFDLVLPAGSWTLRAALEGYADETRTVQVAGGATSTVDFAMGRALESGETLTFANIYFESGSAVLQPSSFPVLDEVAGLLANSPGVSVQVVGHTDSDGSGSYNQTLSENRAASVRTYLVQRGIASSRISTIGMGESSPVASNATPQGKAENRRIEFRIL